jgi:hypothetical protein
MAWATEVAKFGQPEVTCSFATSQAETHHTSP